MVTNAVQYTATVADILPMNRENVMRSGVDRATYTALSTIHPVTYSLHATD